MNAPKLSPFSITYDLFVMWHIQEHCGGNRVPLEQIIHLLQSVHYKEIRNHLGEMETNSAKIHWLARKYEHLRKNQIQLRFLHFNQHSVTLLGIHMRHWAYKREKYTFINANIKVINNLRMDKTNIIALVQSIECSLHFYDCYRFSSIDYSWNQ